VLTTAQIAQGLTTAQISQGLTTAQVNQGLTTTQIAALTTAQVNQGLTTDQVVAMRTSQILALTTSQLSQGLTTDQIVALTTAQVTAMTTGQLMVLTSSQVAAFTTTDVSHLAGFSSPLVLDLSGNGITTQSITAGAQFDLNATGQAVNTGWVTSSEGVLVYDPSNGPITSGSQLFGTATILPNGQTAANGFAALAAMDTNGDGVVTSADAGWSNLKVWVGETSTNGVVQGGQLESLDSLGIVQLNLSYTADPTMNNGNLVGMISSFVTSNGQTHEMADVWFQTSQVQSTNAAVVSTTVSAGFSQSLTTTQIAQALATAQIAALTSTQVAALMPSQVGALSNAGSMQSQIGGMVQAIGSFNQPQSPVVSSSGMPLINSQSSTTVVAGLVGVSVNVAGMVGALQQFGPNGTPVVAPPLVGSVTTATTLTASPLSNPANNGILASGK